MEIFWLNWSLNDFRFRVTVDEALETVFFFLKIFTRPHCGTLSVVNSPCVHRRGQGWIMLSNCFLILLIFLEFYFEMWIGRVRKVRDYIWKASQHCISSHIPICKKISRNWEPRVNFIIGPLSFRRCCSTSRRKWTFPMHATNIPFFEL